MLPLYSLLVMSVSQFAGQTLSAATPRDTNSTSPAGDGWTFETSTSNDSITIQSACTQGGCPDFFKSWDVGRNNAIISPRSYLRINKCNQCTAYWVGSSYQGGCLDFTNCEGSQSICVDLDKARAHWTKNGANKKCYSLKKNEYTCLCAGGYPCTPTFWDPTDVPCTW